MALGDGGEISVLVKNAGEVAGGVYRPFGHGQDKVGNYRHFGTHGSIILIARMISCLINVERRPSNNNSMITLERILSSYDEDSESVRHSHSV